MIRLTAELTYSSTNESPEEMAKAKALFTNLVLQGKLVEFTAMVVWVSGNSPHASLKIVGAPRVKE